jgi:hypothetical protein
MEQVLLRRLDALGRAVDSLRGLAKVRVETDGQSLAGNQVLLVQRPDRLRAEALSPFGNPVLVAAADGTELSVLLPTEGRFLRGPASYRNLARFTRLPVRLADLVSLLLYDVPVIPHHRASATAAGEGGFMLLLEGDEAVRQEFEFDRDLRLLQASFFQREELVMRISYGRFSDQANFPQAISLETSDQRTEATIAFSELAVNVPIPPERFILTPPAGYAVEPLP